jgi:aldose 1-epimerase
VPRVWRTDANSLLVEPVDTPREWAFEPRRPVGAANLDHCFADWNGLAVLEWPDRHVTLRAERCSYLQVYTPAGRNFFCVEPQTAPPGALERGTGEAAVLAPGERLSMEMRLSPREA